MTHSVGFSISGFLLILAIVLFFLASIGRVWAPDPWPWSGRLVAAGLFCWSLSTVV